MPLPKPKPSGYFDRKPEVLENWVHYIEKTQLYFIEQNQRYLDGQARRQEFEERRRAQMAARAAKSKATRDRNKAVHEESARANYATKAAARFKSFISGWKNEDGTSIPKTEAGIPIHERLVARFYELHRDQQGVRLNRGNIELVYQSIRQAAEQEKRNAAADAAFRERVALAAKRKKAHEEAAARERAADAIRDKRNAIRDAKTRIKRLGWRINYYRYAIRVNSGRLDYCKARVARLEDVEVRYAGSSLLRPLVKDREKNRAAIPRYEKKLENYQYRLDQALGERESAKKWLAENDKT